MCALHAARLGVFSFFLSDWFFLFYSHFEFSVSVSIVFRRYVKVTHPVHRLYATAGFKANVWIWITKAIAAYLRLNRTQALVLLCCLFVDFSFETFICLHADRSVLLAIPWAQGSGVSSLISLCNRGLRKYHVLNLTKKTCLIKISFRVFLSEKKGAGARFIVLSNGLISSFILKATWNCILGGFNSGVCEWNWLVPDKKHVLIRQKWIKLGKWDYTEL